MVALKSDSYHFTVCVHFDKKHKIKVSAQVTILLITHWKCSSRLCEVVIIEMVQSHYSCFILWSGWGIPLKATYFPIWGGMEFGKSTQIVEQIESKQKMLTKKKTNHSAKKEFYLSSGFLIILFPKCNEQCESMVVVIVNAIYERDPMHSSIKIASIYGIGIAFDGDQMWMERGRKKKLIALKAHKLFKEMCMHTLTKDKHIKRDDMAQEMYDHRHLLQPQKEQYSNVYATKWDLHTIEPNAVILPGDFLSEWSNCEHHTIAGTWREFNYLYATRMCRR